MKIAYDEKCIYKNIYKKNSFRLGNKQVTKIHKFWNQNFATKNNFALDLKKKNTLIMYLLISTRNERSHVWKLSILYTVVN